MTNNNPPPNPNRKRGAPLGNTNAVKHGFFARKTKQRILNSVRPELQTETEYDLQVFSINVRRVLRLYSSICSHREVLQLITALSTSALTLSHINNRRRLVFIDEDALVAAINRAFQSPPPEEQNA